MKKIEFPITVNKINYSEAFSLYEMGGFAKVRPCGEEAVQTIKSVLISINPKWCELIAFGKKTVEVRKTKPKLETPFRVYIYCTQGKTLDDILTFAEYKNGEYMGDYYANGKVIGEFVCDSIANYEAELWDDETYERIQEFFEPDDFAEYGEYEYKTIADNGDDFWKENMLCQSSCLTIEELRKYVGTGFATFYGWHISKLKIYDEPKELSEFRKYISFLDGETTDELEAAGMNGIRLKRPPQSWCYVEEVKGGTE